MKMIECESVETLPLGENPCRKKRVYNSIAIEELRANQREAFYGPRVERNVVRSPLPEAETLLKMEEVVQLVRVHAWDDPSTKGYIYVPYPNTSRFPHYSMTGVMPQDAEKIYKVVGYSGDISNPFKSNLQMYYQCVYPASNFVPVRSVPTRLIAAGHIRYQVISGNDFAQLTSHEGEGANEI